MKIYFAGSIRGGRNDRETYLEIIKYLAKYGEVVTEHVADKNITSSGESLPQTAIYKRDIDRLGSSDVVVAEVTTPSLGVGYELGAANSLGKRTLCLYRGDTISLSAMVAGNEHFVVRGYDQLSEVFAHIDEFFKDGQ